MKSRTQIPKTASGAIDKEKLKKQFFHSSALSARDFAKDYNYDRSQLAAIAPWKAWAKEKIAECVRRQDEKAETKALNIRGKLLSQQFEFLEKVPDLNFRLLSLVDAAIKKHEEDLTADIDDKESGEASKPGWKPRFYCDPKELCNLVSACTKLSTELGKSLLMNHASAPLSDLVFNDLNKILESQPKDQSREPNLVSVRGLGIVDPEAVQKVMREFYDQSITKN